MTCYKGGLTPCGEKLEKQDIWVREGRIVDPQQLFFRERKSPDYVINCSNHIVSPGFIDIQINGVYIFGSYHGRVLVCGSLFGCHHVWNGMQVDLESTSLCWNQRMWSRDWTQ